MNSEKIKISVVMSVYNGKEYLKPAISSVLCQIEKDFEFIIVDDGSTDDTEKIVRSFDDKRIKYLKKEHSGLVDSLNFGIKKAQGEFIARFDADDICMPERLEKQLQFFKENPKYILVGSYATKIDEFGESVGEFIYPPLTWQDIKKYSLLHNPFIHSTVMFRKSIIDKVRNYRNFSHIEDYELWTRIIYKYPCANIGEALLKYRIHGGQITKKKALTMRLNGIFVRILAIFRFIFRF